MPGLAILFQKGVGRLGAAGLLLAGLSEVFQGVLPEHVAHGLAWIGAGLVLLDISMHATRATTMIATTQAENKIQSPHLDASSADPAVQREIDKQVTAAATAPPATPPDADLAKAAADMKDALSSFDPAHLTADRILTVAKTLFPERLGSAIWINVITGRADEGATFEVFKKDKFTADLLAGHVTAGLALGYQIAQSGALAVSVFGGATHPYDGALTSGWAPVLGVKIRF